MKLLVMAIFASFAMGSSPWLTDFEAAKKTAE